jgi:outer membrane biosynthesis protein TonB
VEQNMTLLQIGEVKVKFFVRANGVIDQISISGSGRTDVLETISRQAVDKASGVMEPFSDNMKAQFGEGFWDEITFTIY